VHTVKFHVASLIDKLGARGRVEAVAIAIRTGVIMV
jgi:DNA-binding CsgD family transcriptional regulator